MGAIQKGALSEGACIEHDSTGRERVGARVTIRVPKCIDDLDAPAARALAALLRVGAREVERADRRNRYRLPRLPR